MRHLIILILSLAALPNKPALAHGGGLAADGCHNDKKNGGRHCHGGDVLLRRPRNAHLALMRLIQTAQRLAQQEQHLFVLGKQAMGVI